MNPELIKYRITPRIVKAGEISQIKVEGVDSSTRFYDDTDYKITITADDCWNYKEGTIFSLEEREMNQEFILKPENGVISFKFLFSGEHKWKVNIARVEDEKHVSALHKKMWPHMFSEFFKGFDFTLYSLEEDLYNKRPYKGDLHVHTTGSDGRESGALTAAGYRKWGYDFISITDHLLLEPSLETRDYYKDIPTGFHIIPGEEVHQQFPRGSFHMVSLNPERSVNEVLRKEPERAESEMREIAKTMPGETEEDRLELAWFKWVYDETKKAGGISVYPHPFWDIFGGLNIRTETSKEIYRRGFTDCFEILGGTCDKEHNRMQVSLYYEMQKEGINLPIVAATDSHSALAHGLKQFDQVWNITFSESPEKIPENILNGYTTAVDNYVPTDKNVYGSFRLVHYTWFLIEEYYPLRDELCSAAGGAITRYVLGDKGQKELIALLEKEVEKFDNAFFGSLH